MSEPDDEVIAALAAAVGRRIGHDLVRRRDEFRRAVAALAPVYGNPDEMRAAVEMEDGPSAILDEFVRELTIGETMFFRHPEQFELLAARILPELITRRRAEGSLRLSLWSAGCATGEEPYSIAILLAQLIPDIDAWEITIRGTDLNPAFLDAAAEATYGDWSFRSCDSGVRSWFSAAGRRWRLDDRARRLVSLGTLNLVSDPYPERVDVIFCRNVLIYFETVARCEVLGRLCDALAPGGWMIVGHADVGMEPVAGVEHRFGAESFIYQRTETIAIPEPVKEIPQRLPRTRPRRSGAERTRPPQAADAKVLVAEAATHFDRGDDELAAEMLRRSLYLDPRQPAAHYLAGLVDERRGSHRRAFRHYRAAMVVLSGLRDDAVVEGMNGVTAQRLLHALEALLRNGAERDMHV